MINRAIHDAINRRKREINSAHVPAVGDNGYFVCEATEVQWRQYMQSESQALVSRAMEWQAISEARGTPTPAVRRGKVYIVELPGEVHDTVIFFLNLAFLHATGMDAEHVVGHNATYIDGDLKQPDLSYGPERGIGVIRPADIRSWTQFSTLTVEIGVSRGWPYLERKAAHWATISGVVYVLLIYVSPGLQVRQYTLYEVHRPAATLLVPAPDPVLVAVPLNQTKIGIQAADVVPPTTIQFDARRLLALPNATVNPAADTLLQTSYPTGVVEINLSRVIERVIHQVQ